MSYRLWYSAAFLTGEVKVEVFLRLMHLRQFAAAKMSIPNPACPVKGVFTKILAIRPNCAEGPGALRILSIRLYPPLSAMSLSCPISMTTPRLRQPDEPEPERIYIYKGSSARRTPSASSAGLISGS